MMSDNSMDARNMKRKINDGMNETAWKMMRKMGYERGQGLGTHAQGIVEPVDVSKQKGRRGLGLVPKSETSGKPSGYPYKSTDSSLVWTQDTDVASADSDKIWYWRPHADQMSKHFSLHSSLRSICLSPDSPDAIGPPIREMDDQFKFCSQHLVTELLTYKNQLDDVSNVVVTESHQRCNPYELIKKGIFMNRAAMKLANMDAILDGILTNSSEPDEIMYFADVCAGPGGFSEYILWRRCNALPLRPTSPGDEAADKTETPDDVAQNAHPLAAIPHLTAKGFGLTLTGNCDFRLNDFLAGPSEAFCAHYGPSQDGDITKWANLSSFSALIDRTTAGQGVHVLVADGGFDVSGKHNLQEVLSKRIYLCQCLCALIVLRRGGHFITKLFDVFTEFSVGLIYLVGQLFEEVAIIKPVTSRPANSERYLFCKNLLSPLTGMAGCPASPKNGSKAASSTAADSGQVEFRHKDHKLPGQGRVKNNTPLSGDREFGVLDRDRAGVLGELIEYLIRVNEKIGYLESTASESGTSCTKLDVLRLCDTDTLMQNAAFYTFITKMNQEFAVQQCVALSKLLTFAYDPRLSDSRQPEMKAACLERWKVNMIERKPVPWPLMTSNRSAVIHELIGDSEKRKSLNILPTEYLPHKRTSYCISHDLSNIERLIGSRIALVCGTSSMSADSRASQPMLVYSRGGQDFDTQVTIDGDTWSKLVEVVPSCQPRLPPGTLIWGQATYEYVAKNKRRRYALTIFDVICIYGYDCRKLPYRQRMEVAERMCEVVNFPGMFGSSLRVPPMLSLRGLPDYVKQLPLLPCKDASGNVPMHRYPDGMLFRPNLILLVEHLANSWSEAIGRSTGQIYYFNYRTSESTFCIPSDQHLSFTHTHFTKVPWTGDNAGYVNVSQLVAEVEHFNATMSDGY